jgi:hypothetical protein
MSLKNIISSYKLKRQNLKKDLANKKELMELKTNPTIKKLGLKNILEEYKTHIQAKKILSTELIQKEINLDSFMNMILIQAFEHLNKEFEEFGEERKSKITIKPLQVSITIYNMDTQEYIYRITVKNDNNKFQINANIYSFNTSGELTQGNEEKLFKEKNMKQITEDDILNDFYTRFREYLLSTV